MSYAGYLPGDTPTLKSSDTGERKESFREDRSNTLYVHLGYDLSDNVSIVPKDVFN